MLERLLLSYRHLGCRERGRSSHGGRVTGYLQGLRSVGEEGGNRDAEVEAQPTWRASENIVLVPGVLFVSFFAESF